MNTMRSIIIVTAAVLLAAQAAPAAAQESSYRPGTVWEVSRIKVLPGQFENYMDWLAGNWKKVQEAGKAEGVIVDYHVLATNDRRADEPDLVLVVEYKDYMTTAQQEAMRKKVNALLAQTDRQATTASGERSKMREQVGGTQYQELVLK